MTKKTYFISDAHLGMYPNEKSLENEKLLVQWMDEIKQDVAELYLLGDIFDFWYEYKKVVPRGFTRFLGKLSEFRDANIPVYFFTGNHDIWSFNYLEEECGVKIIRKPIETEIMGKRFYLAHGDGLGPGDKLYLIMKWCFHNKILQWMFSRLHPNLALGLGQAWSKKSRLTKGIFAGFKGEDEWLIQYSKKILKKDYFDYFIFGHRHLAVNLKLDEKSNFTILGDWIFHFTYAVFDGEELKLMPYRNEGENNIITSLRN